MSDWNYLYIQWQHSMSTIDVEPRYPITQLHYYNPYNCPNHE
jgi:hypothetical protein